MNKKGRGPYPLTKEISGVKINGFDVTEDGILFVACEDTDELIIYEDIDWSSLRYGGPRQYEKLNIGVDVYGTPMGVRVTPYGTMTVSTEKSGEFVVAEFLIMKGLTDYEIFAERIVVRYDSVPGGSGDMALTFNRKGIYVSMLRPFSSDLPTEIDVNNPTISISEIFVENTSPDFIMTLDSRKTVFREKDTENTFGLIESEFFASGLELMPGGGGHLGDPVVLESDYECKVEQSPIKGKIYSVVIKYTFSFEEMSEKGISVAVISFEVTAVDPGLKDVVIGRVS